MKKNLILMSALFAGSMFMNDGFGAHILAAVARTQNQQNIHQIDVVRGYGADDPSDTPEAFFYFDPGALVSLSPAEKKEAEEKARKARIKKYVKYGLTAATAIACTAAYYLYPQYLPAVVAACTAVPSVIPSKGGFNVTASMYCGIKSSTVEFKCGDYQNMTSLIAELDEKYPNLNSTKYFDTFKEICPDLDSDTQENVEPDNTPTDLKNSAQNTADNIEKEHIDLDSDTQEDVEPDNTHTDLKNSASNTTDNIEEEHIYLDSDTQENVEPDNTHTDLKNSASNTTDNIEEEHIYLDSDTQEDVEPDNTSDSATHEIDEHICDGITDTLERAGCIQGKVLGGYNKDNPRITNILNFVRALFNF